MKTKEISKSYYSAVHHWLKYHYGKATKCENKECLGKSKNFNWALREGKKYEYNRDNFIELCRVCHAKYDVTPATRQKMRELNENTYRTHCKRGHEFTPENTERRKDNPSWRLCRTCHELHNRLWREEQRRKLSILKVIP